AGSFVSAGYGSFATRRVDLFRAAQADGWQYAAFASYLGSQGDFDFRNTNGTAQNPDDDFEARRRNNDFDQASRHLNLARRTSGGELRIGLDTFYKTQGVPGTSSAELRGAHLSSFRQTAELQIDRRQLLGPRGSGRGRAWLAVERRRFDDPVASDFG